MILGCLPVNQIPVTFLGSGKSPQQADSAVIKKNKNHTAFLFFHFLEKDDNSIDIE